ncbi:MAG: ABC transporter permease subunit [Spirochaetaceae bacterium]|jgi:ABC-type dipeptide/oligopeptide/nickel transport system permease subunit|nr:ABC transporter permease subunit [Spirochaetaceae bacterium]
MKKPSKRSRKIALYAAPPVLLLSAALLAPLLAPRDPLALSLSNTLSPPSAEYPLGTDELGRCILSRLLAGSRLTLGTALVIEASILGAGVAAGLAAGFFAGVFDALLVCIIDILLAFPSIILALVLSGVLGAGLHNLTLAMMAVYWVEPARIARSSARAAREKEFVLSARALGCSSARIIFKHVLPEILPAMLVFGTMQTAHIVIALSSLSFLGLGARPPAPEWGALLAEQRNNLFGNPLAAAALLLCLTLSCACFQYSGEKLRDTLNPCRSCLP